MTDPSINKGPTWKHAFICPPSPPQPFLRRSAGGGRSLLGGGLIQGLPLSEVLQKPRKCPPLLLLLWWKAFQPSRCLGPFLGRHLVEQFAHYVEVTQHIFKVRIKLPYLALGAGSLHGTLLRTGPSKGPREPGEAALPFWGGKASPWASGMPRMQPRAASLVRLMA